MIEFSSVTSDGGREINEDRLNTIKLDDNHFCFIVADGLGGHGMGDIASTIAVENAEDVFRSFCDNDDVVEQIFESVQKRVLYEQKHRRTRFSIKTTLAVVAVTNSVIHMGHIGDTRIYCFKGGVIKSRTLDHSVPQMLVSMGKITEDQIRNHPDRNRLLRVIGEEWEGAGYQLAESVSVNDVSEILICSDGFWELIKEEDMSKLIKESENAEEWLASMTEIVKAAGKPLNEKADNYSAIAIMIRQ